jgi:hypothetical protein
MPEILLREEVREIDGHKYAVKVFQAGASLKMLRRVGLFVGPSISRSFDEIGTVMDSLMSALRDHPDVDVLVADLLAGVTVDGEKLQGEKCFDLWFAGKLGTLWNVVKFVVEANWQDFFDELQADVKRKMEAFLAEQKKQQEQAKA